MHTPESVAGGRIPDVIDVIEALERSLLEEQQVQPQYPGTKADIKAAEASTKAWAKIGIIDGLQRPQAD